LSRSEAQPAGSGSRCRTPGRRLSAAPSRRRSAGYPIASKIEVRKEGKLGRVYCPAPYLTDDSEEYYADTYEIGYEKIIDTYAAATGHLD